MKIITITGYKGGVGKSTTAVHIAEFLSKHGNVILVDGDPNRTAIDWHKRGELSFEVANEKEAMRIIPTKDYVVIDTPARPNSEDIKELANGCDLLILPTKPDIVSLEPMLETANDLSGAKFKALLTIVPPYPSKEGEVLKEELKKEGIPVFESMVRRTVGFEKAALAGVAINNLSDDRFSSAWQDYEDLGKEILEELK